MRPVFDRCNIVDKGEDPVNVSTLRRSHNYFNRMRGWCSDIDHVYLLRHLTGSEGAGHAKKIHQECSMTT